MLAFLLNPVHHHVWAARGYCWPLRRGMANARGWAAQTLPVYCGRSCVVVHSAAEPVVEAGTASRLLQVLDGSRMAAAGGIAGVIARTATAPLDRVKLLFQVQVCSTLLACAGWPLTFSLGRCVLRHTRRRVYWSCASVCKGSTPWCCALLFAGSDVQAQIYREEGLRSFWKGNGTNVIRVAPYAAAQLSSNDFYKRLLSGARL